MSDEGCFWIGGLKLGGPGDDYVLTSVDYPSADVRSADVDTSISDGVRFGRDTLGAGTFSFQVLIAPADGDAWAAMNRLAAVWRTSTVRAKPGVTMPLTFQRAGQRLTVYGRPRKWQPDAGDADTLAQGAVIVSCDFKTDGPLVGVGTQRAESLGLLAPLGDGGVTIPVDVPIILSAGATSDQAREGVFTVGGTERTPFVLDITGPVSGSLQNATVAGNGWRIEVTRPLAWDQTLRVDTRTMTVTINGAPAPGAVSARTRLTGRLTPGYQSFTFTGIDDTASARATLRWYDTTTL